MVIRSLGVILAAVMAVSIMLTLPLMAADTPVTVGFVDVQNIFQSYDKTSKAKADLEALGKQLDEQMKTLESYKLLSDKDRQDLQALLAKENPTDKDKEQIKAIEDKERALDTEFKDLQSKKEPTEQDKARLKELQDISTKSDEALNQMSATFQTRFSERQAALTEDIRKDIVSAVESVAKQKNLSVVVDKIAVITGGVDITQLVLDKLNGKK